MQIEKALEELGLTQIEITIYLYLLSNGESLGNQIHKENFLDKSSTYKAISQLISRGLVTAIGDSRNQVYKVSPKEHVFSLFENKKKEIETSKNTFSKVFEDIEKYSATYYQNENIQIFTGENAFTSYHKEMLRIKCEVIRTFTSSDTQLKIAQSKKSLDKAMDWFVPERVNKNISIRVLYDSDATPDEYDVSDPSKFKECRRYSKRLAMPAIMSTFGDRVGFSTIKKGKYWSIIIHDKLIVTLLNSLYDAIWDQSIIVNKST